MKGFVYVVCLVSIAVSACSAVPQGVPKAANDAAASEMIEEKRSPDNGDVGTLNTMVESEPQAATPAIPPMTMSQDHREELPQRAEEKNLIAENIRAGVTIYGVTGDSNIVNTASGNAAAGEVLSDRTVWVDGQEVSGLLEITSCVDLPNCSETNGSCVFSYDACARETGIFSNWTEVVDGLRYNKYGARMTYGWCSGRAECCQLIR